MNAMPWSLGAVAALTLISPVSATPPASTPTTVVFARAGAPAPSELIVDVSFDALASITAGVRFEIPVPSGNDVEAIVERVMPATHSDFVMRGRIEGASQGWFLLVVNRAERVIVGEATVPGHGHHHLRPTADGLHKWQKVDEASRLQCTLPPAPVMRRAASDRPGPAPDGGIAGGDVTVDVMVLYTPSSRNEVGGEAEILALIDSYIAYTDMVFEASGIVHRFRLVHAGEVAYVESGNSITDLARLKHPGDGFMDEIHTLRDATGADLVSLINTSGAAGTGYVMTDLSIDFEDCGFSAIGANTDPLPGGLVFAHETGHNMGCNHNNGVGAPDAVFCYSYGHRTPDLAWRTIMSSGPGTLIDFFSNPDLQFEGFPLGVPGDGCPPDGADNVRSLNIAAPVVAQFRPRVIVDPCLTDLNGDGETGPADLAAVLDAWGPSPGHPADFNEDGQVGPPDLALLLDAWGPCR